MKIEEIFGSTEAIDLISRRGDIVDMLMLINGYVGDTAEERGALERKFAYYKNWTESEEFSSLYGEAEVGIVITFTERPSDGIISLLNDLHREMSGARSELRVTIGGLPLLFIDN